MAKAKEKEKTDLDLCNAIIAKGRDIPSRCARRAHNEAVTGMSEHLPPAKAVANIAHHRAKVAEAKARTFMAKVLEPTARAARSERYLSSI